MFLKLPNIRIPSFFIKQKKTITFEILKKKRIFLQAYAGEGFRRNEAKWIGSLQRSNGMRSHMENASATSAAKKSGESTHCKR